MCEREGEASGQREVYHTVDLPLPSECPHREIVWHRYDAEGKLGAMVYPTRLHKAVRVANLGEMWQPGVIQRQSASGPVIAGYGPDAKAEAVLRAYTELGWLLQKLEEKLEKGETLPKAMEEARKGNVSVYLPIRQGSDLPPTWVRMQREWVRLPVAVWEDAQGRVW